MAVKSATNPRIGLGRETLDVVLSFLKCQTKDEIKSSVLSNWNIKFQCSPKAIMATLEIASLSVAAKQVS